jgi:hypothetical protein
MLASYANGIVEDTYEKYFIDIFYEVFSHVDG